MANRAKYAIVHIGNDEAYGLLFVANELIRLGLNIEWFDGDYGDVVHQIVTYNPNFVFFSPMTVFLDQALQLSIEIKARLKKTHCVFGGHHVSAIPECIELDGIDTLVCGPVYGTIDKITGSSNKEVLNGTPVLPNKMFPARREYYSAIPRMARFPRKTLMSHFGCVFNCSYCSTSRVRKHYGPKVYNQFWLKRRPVEHLIKEAKICLDYSPKEFELADDDSIMGNEVENWLQEFKIAWKREIGLPIYGYVSPLSALKISNRVLETLSDLMTCVTMGIQTARKDSLKLFNRSYQTEEMLKQAYDRLQSFGICTRLDLIVGLPVDDPVGDALETIKLAQRIGAGTCAICYPLMIYPGTDLYDWCTKYHISLNEQCTMEWHTGIGSVKFDEETNRRLRNIKKLATMFVKNNIEEHWMRALIEADMTKTGSKKLSESQYYETLKFRLGNKGVENFDKILAGIDFKY